MIEKLLISFMGGVAGHQTRRFTRNMSPGWRNIIEHAIGGMLILPFLLLFQDDDLPSSHADYTKKTATAYLLSIFGVGSGVAAGWLLDSIAWAGSDE